MNHPAANNGAPKRLHEYLLMIIEEELPGTYKALFPILQDCTYLDTGTVGISAPQHAAAAAAFFNEGKCQGALGREKWQNKAAEVKGKLAKWLNVEASEIEFFSGTTDALNIISHSMEWKTGDEIVVADDDFPSTRGAWQVAEKSGAKIRKISIDSESEREDQIAEALTPGTRLLAVSQVHSTAGTRLDLEQLGARCRENNTLFVVDGIHGFGAVKPTLDKVDAYMSGTFKWMLAGFGISVCVIKHRLREHLLPSFRGYLNEPPSSELQFAHINYPGIYTLDASLVLLGETIGWETIYQRTAALASWLTEDLSAGDIQVVTPAEAQAGIVSFRVPNPEASRLQLLARGVHVAARGPYLRASPFFYNSRQDVKRLADLIIGDSKNFEPDL